MGEVQRLYIESNGAFPLMKKSKDFPSLSVVPVNDKPFEESVLEYTKEMCSCTFCGLTKKINKELHECTNFGNNDWKASILENE
jgi:hypothetical protein